MKGLLQDGAGAVAPLSLQQRGAVYPVLDDSDRDLPVQEEREVEAVEAVTNPLDGGWRDGIPPIIRGGL